MSQDHDNGLEKKGHLILFEDVKVKSQDVCEEENAANIDGESSHRSWFLNHVVLMDIADDRPDSHRWVITYLQTSISWFILFLGIPIQIKFLQFIIWKLLPTQKSTNTKNQGNQGKFK